MDFVCIELITCGISLVNKFKPQHKMQKILVDTTSWSQSIPAHCNPVIRTGTPAPAAALALSP